MAIIHLTTENFEKEVQQFEQPVLIDFWAPWCGPCRMLAPILEEAETEVSENDLGKICKVNVDEQPALAAKYGVMGIPTLIMIKDGEEVDKQVGLCSKDKIIDMFQKQNDEVELE